MIKLVLRIRKIFIKKVKLLKDSVCNVAVVNPPRGSFDYITTETFYVGQIVIVPLRSKICLGIVLGKGKSRIDKSKLRIRFYSFTNEDGKVFTNVYNNNYNCRFPKI